MSSLKPKITCLSFLYLLFAINSFSQKATITEIRLYADKRDFHPPKPYKTIFYPVIHLKDTNVQRRINQSIFMEIIAQGNSALKELKNKIKEEGLTDVNYTITMNQQWILFLYIESEYGRGIISRNTLYFNFDLHTGEEIKIDDLLDRAQKDSFQRKVSIDKIDSLKQFINLQMVELKKYTTDSDSYKWAIEQLEDCIDSAHLDQFSLYPRFIEIIDVCQPPRTLPVPEYLLKYPFKTYYYILDKKYRNIFKPKN
jgi:hypothetical protein